MERQEVAKKMGWFHVFFLKALMFEPESFMSTPEIVLKMNELFKVNGISYHSHSIRTLIGRHSKELVLLGIVLKKRGDSAYFRVNPDYKSACLLFVSGFTELWNGRNFDGKN